MTTSFDAGDDDGPPVELPMLRCRRERCDGRIFQDARGGFECTDCDARYLIVQDPPNGYGGPLGRLGWFERLKQADELRHPILDFLPCREANAIEPAMGAKIVRRAEKALGLRAL